MSAISVNGTGIGDAEIDAEMQYHPAPTRAAARKNAAEALVVRRLLLDEVARLGVSVDEPARENGALETEEEAVIRALLAREIATPEPDEAACRRYYEGHRRRFHSPELFEAAHILFAAAPGAAPARARARQAAEETLAELARAPERFADLARARSACSSAPNGGSLGQVSRGDTVAEFETYLLSLDPGEICAAPVETRYGYHIVRLDRRRAGRELPFDLVHARIAAYLVQVAWRRAVHQYVQILAGAGRIAGLDLGQTSSPLVQ